MDTICLEIEDVAFGGAGVGHVDRMAVFVPYTIVGERVEAQVVRRKNRFIEARLLRVIDPSEQRREPRCPWFGRCGGCQYQHIDYPFQLEIKRKQLADALQRIGGLVDIVVPPVVAAPKCWAYRNKIVLHGPGRPGYMELDNKTILPITACPIADEAINNCLAEVTAENKGIDGELVIRSNQKGQAWHYVRSAGGDSGSEMIEEQLCGRTFLTPLRSFGQVNPGIVPSMIDFLAAELSGSTLVDTYCGAGAFALSFASKLSKIIGVDTDPVAIQAAKMNAKELGCTNTLFVAERAEKALREMLPNLELAETAVILDPPRGGLSAEVVDALLRSRPAVVFCVSCNPPVLARDLKRLGEAGYSLNSVMAFDMFPQTTHFEVIAKLSNSSKEH